MPFPIPAKLLEKIASVDLPPVSLAFCPNFELGAWRYNQLASHLFDWLPDVALRPDEREALLFEPYKQISRSCVRLFDTADPARRGEIGEILIHALCRQEFNTEPFVARLFYKMRSNDSVTSVDLVHLTFDQQTRKIDLWLGESKLHTSMSTAKNSTIASIAPIWDPNFLREMKALIGPKADRSSPYSEELIWLFSEETPLDEIIGRIVVPICIACDFKPTKDSRSRTSAYIDHVKSELESLRDYFSSRVEKPNKIVCFFLPMNNKDKLETRFNEIVRTHL